mmetsp:Transcript_61863/g.108348  ORF Transcript_61863/g.108348 Transcript_61863/m.108348 type:complete len:92 (+) Transcript_61863:193-468(+)
MPLSSSHIAVEYMAHAGRDVHLRAKPVKKAVEQIILADIISLCITVATPRSSGTHGKTPAMPYQCVTRHILHLSFLANSPNPLPAARGSSQ